MLAVVLLRCVLASALVVLLLACSSSSSASAGRGVVAYYRLALKVILDYIWFFSELFNLDDKITSLPTLKVDSCAPNTIIS